MGNRALVVFHDSEDYSPITYLHWGGSHVPQLLADWWAYMEGRRSDLAYGAARFIGICHENTAGNLSLGVWNTPKDVGHPEDVNRDAYWTKQSHGDAGVFLVDVRSGKVRRVDGSMAECDAEGVFTIASVQEVNQL